MKSERSLAPISTHKPVLKSALFLSAHLDQSGRSTWIACFFQALCESLDQACRCLYIAHLSRTCSTLISSTEYKSFGFPAYVRRCIDMLCTHEPPSHEPPLGCMQGKPCVLLYT